MKSIIFIYGSTSVNFGGIKMINNKVKNWFEIHLGLSPMIVSTKADSEWILSKCPYHKANNRTFIVKGNGNYHCLQCGSIGNLFEIPDSDVMPEPADYGRIHSLLKAANRFFVKQLEYSDEAKDYIKDRKLDEESVKNFSLGYCGSTSVIDFLKKNGFSRQEMLESGLFSENDNLDLYCKMQWRLTFPIKDMYGNIISFGGRVISGDRQPKYKNGAETNIFHKKENLYGFDIARETGKNFLIICEGYMDTISMHRYGIKNAVASLGTALTHEQALLIKSVADRAILLYDSDIAGKKATERAIEVLSDAGVRVFVAEVLPYKDADEMVTKEGAENLKERLRHPLPAKNWLYKQKIISGNLQEAVSLILS